MTPTPSKSPARGSGPGRRLERLRPSIMNDYLDRVGSELGLVCTNPTGRSASPSQSQITTDEELDDDEYEFVNGLDDEDWVAVLDPSTSTDKEPVTEPDPDAAKVDRFDQILSEMRQGKNNSLIHIDTFFNQLTEAQDAIKARKDFGSFGTKLLVRKIEVMLLLSRRLRKSAARSTGHSSAMDPPRNPPSAVSPSAIDSPTQHRQLRNRVSPETLSSTALLPARSPISTNNRHIQPITESHSSFLARWENMYRPEWTQSIFPRNESLGPIERTEPEDLLQDLRRSENLSRLPPVTPPNSSWLGPDFRSELLRSLPGQSKDGDTEEKKDEDA
ncbi:hypothetical protein B0J11DRAFT_584249 [Dendryphion nanum]|uniref:Uncharacterized protein n=1 Tax=Dendryphion nanum TaxID=256645 RepID=A0A9P9DCB9_9PLEO|nr:hypothetical protein B0J11DRAFT_584249 [Dendryphion nanum]